MKKVFLVAAFAVFGLSVNAQETSFGLTAGYTNISFDIEVLGTSVSASESGFYIGALADIGISEAFHVQPEVLYASAGEASFLLIPIMAKYYVGESGFNIQAGPQFNLTMEEQPDGVSSLGIGLGAGVGYDINENIFVEARYSLELTNRFEEGDAELKYNIITVGVGYKF